MFWQALQNSCRKFTFLFQINGRNPEIAIFGAYDRQSWSISNSSMNWKSETKEIMTLGQTKWTAYAHSLSLLILYSIFTKIKPLGMQASIFGACPKPG